MVSCQLVVTSGLESVAVIHFLRLAGSFLFYISLFLLIPLSHSLRHMKTKTIVLSMTSSLAQDKAGTTTVSTRAWRSGQCFRPCE